MKRAWASLRFGVLLERAWLLGLLLRFGVLLERAWLLSVYSGLAYC